jgi:hypothetical protein
MEEKDYSDVRVVDNSTNQQPDIATLRAHSSDKYDNTDHYQNLQNHIETHNQTWIFGINHRKLQSMNKR